MLENILNTMGDMGLDAMITLLVQIIDKLGQGTEFTGEQIARLGEAEQMLAQLVSRAKSE